MIAAIRFMIGLYPQARARHGRCRERSQSPSMPPRRGVAQAGLQRLEIAVHVGQQGEDHARHIKRWRAGCDSTGAVVHGSTEKNMNKSRKLAALFTGTLVVSMFTASSAFAESRHRDETRNDE